MSTKLVAVIVCDHIGCGRTVRAEGTDEAKLRDSLVNSGGFDYEWATREVDGEHYDFCYYHWPKADWKPPK